MDCREKALSDWVAKQLELCSIQAASPLTLEAVSGDASFRRYFRAQGRNFRFIAMDAPPEKEDSAPFVAIAQSWLAQGVPVPKIIAKDLVQGFLLLSDFGDTLYLQRLKPDTADSLYALALNTLLDIQACGPIAGYPLPTYDAERLRNEMALCPEWFLQQLLRLPLADWQEIEHRLYELLITSALEQPQVCAHRDYHSRNLMLCEDGTIGVLDFQDAVFGPITYDLASLIRDCYIHWPADREENWIRQYLALATEKGLLTKIDFPQFKRWFDLMGLQRHIKCVGIFSRLYLRDNKPGYLKDIPRTFHYLQAVCAQYPELGAIHQYLQQTVIPAMRDKQTLFHPAGPAQ